jgi:cell shape-determining protein MreC
MTKVLFILSAVVILVASFFAYQNGREFAEVRNKIAVVNASILSEKKTEDKLLRANGDVSKVKTEIARVQGDLDVEAEKLKAQKNKLAQTEGEVTRTREEFAVKEKKKLELEELLKGLPLGMKPDSLAEDIQKFKKEKLEFEAMAEAKKKEVAAEEDKVAGIQKRLDEVVHKIEDRRKNFERNSLSSRVVAVNYDWGFVVIDAGKSTGLTEQTKLIVTRGAQTVGKISIMSVDSKNSMAAIVPDAVLNSQIMPGDRVILENLVQN